MGARHNGSEDPRGLTARSTRTRGAGVRLIALLAMLLAAAANDALAEGAITGHHLVPGAEAFRRGVENRASSDDQSLTFYFIGYIAGATDVLFGDQRFCPPQGTTKGQYAAMVQKYLKAHPEEWNEEAMGIVLAALRQEFPCK